MEKKYFIYARKSTESEDRQLLSIEAQITELRAFAKKEHLNIIDVLVEKQSAKIPGRPIFNEMMKKIEAGEASGILAWHPDRLARNSVDGGQIIYLIDCGLIKSLKFPQFWFEPTPQGKFMLNMAFGQSKYYVDSLSENVKRGLRQKVRKGIYPSIAPLGYINNVRNKNIAVDKKNSVIVRKAFELYAKGESRLEDISNFLADSGITTCYGKRIQKTRVSFTLANSFYVGLFKYGGETYEGIHEPIISKKLFDRVQEVLKYKGRPRKSHKINPQVYCGLIRCGTCGMMITGEYRVKKQLNGNEHHYTYYHCSKKNKTIKCDEPCIRQEELDKQLSNMLQKVSLKSDWAERLLEMAESDKKTSAKSVSAFVQKTNKRVEKIGIRLERLLNGYLEQDIERSIYRKEKNKLLLEKKSLEENIITFEQKQNNWLEPFNRWVKLSQTLVKITRGSNLFAKKVAVKEIFSSNLRLTGRKATGKPIFPYLSTRSVAERIGKESKSSLIMGRARFELAKA